MDPEEVNNHPNEYIGEKIAIERYYIEKLKTLTETAFYVSSSSATEGSLGGEIPSRVELRFDNYSGDVQLVEDGVYQFIGEPHIEDSDTGVYL